MITTCFKKPKVEGKACSMTYPLLILTETKLGKHSSSEEKRTNACKPSWWDIEPDVGRVAHGVAARVDRLKAIGNGQVPAVAATAWKLLSEA